MMSAESAPLRQKVPRASRDRIVLEYMPLAKAIAVRVHQDLPVQVDLDDLIHAGILGLIDAAEKYDPDKRVAFNCYAKHRIRGAILDSLRQQDWASRDLRRRQKQVEAVTHELSMQLGRLPTEAEVAERMGVAVDRWRQMAGELRKAGLVSFSSRGNDRDGTITTPPEPAGKQEFQPDDIFAREQQREMLLRAVRTLPDRYQKVIELYYVSEKTMKEIGGLLGINESRVSQMHKTALEKMALVLQANGITCSYAF